MTLFDTDAEAHGRCHRCGTALDYSPVHDPQVCATERCGCGGYEAGDEWEPNDLQRNIFEGARA